MADLSTYANVDSELAATADYDVERDVAKAKRRVAALRRKLDFASMSMDNKGGMSTQFDQRVIQSQLDQAIAFIKANESVSESDRLSNPNVVHSDFSTFGQYAQPEGEIRA